MNPGLSLHDSLTMAVLACGDVACLEQWMHLYPPPSEATTRCCPQVRISPPCKSLIGPPRALSRVWKSPTRANLCLLCSPPGVADPPSAPHPRRSTGFSALPGGMRAWRRTALAGAAKARSSWPQRSPRHQPRGFPACRPRRSSQSKAFFFVRWDRPRLCDPSAGPAISSAEARPEVSVPGRGRGPGHPPPRSFWAPCATPKQSETIVYVPRYRSTQTTTA